MNGEDAVKAAVETLAETLLTLGCVMVVHVYAMDDNLILRGESSDDGDVGFTYPDEM
jgi:hypothetical protein